MDNYFKISHDLIAESYETALNGDYRKAIDSINFAKELCPCEFSVSMAAANMLSEISKIMIAHVKSAKTTHSEYGTVQAWFKKNHKNILPCFSLEKSKADKFVPDFMVSCNGKYYPVECKKTFNNRSLVQLITYMNYFGSDRGYAVGNKLKCELPDNIVFIECPVTDPSELLQS